MPAHSDSIRYAICNETFEGWPHERVCEYVAGLGYRGLELAPFTLAPRITDVSPQRRREIRAAAERHGLQIIGLHWLLAKTTGLSLTSADESVREATAAYLGELARCCRDLGGNLLVFGSPAQRRIPAGATVQRATDYALDTFLRASSVFSECDVTLCLEPLSRPEADFINTAREARELLRKLGHSNFKLHLDVKAMSTDEAPAPELIRRHASVLAHFHANDPNLCGPGFGSTDFVPIFRALRDSGYSGWVSVEVFDYKPGPETIARESLRYMRECEASARSGLVF
jgi:sugar phosphate isomerase/epimerase